MQILLVLSGINYVIYHRDLLYNYLSARKVQFWLTKSLIYLFGLFGNANSHQTNHSKDM